MGSMEPGKIYAKMLRNLSGKLWAKFPTTTHGYFMVKIACINDAFSEYCELEGSPVEDESPQKKKIRIGEKRKWGKRNENLKVAQLDFSVTRIAPLSIQQKTYWCARKGWKFQIGYISPGPELP